MVALRGVCNHSRRGRASAGFALVVDVPLAPDEKVVWLDRDYSFVTSAHGNRAAFLVSPVSAPDAAALTLVIVDYASSSVLHRIPLADSEEGFRTIEGSDDGNAVDVAYDTPDGRVERSFSFADGAERPIVRPDAWLRDAARHAWHAEIGGSTVLFQGEGWAHAWDIAAPRSFVVADEGCVGVLSPRGRQLLCDGYGEPFVVYRIGDGKKTIRPKPSWFGSHSTAAGVRNVAVADDGTIAAVRGNTVGYTRGNNWIRRDLAEGERAFDDLAEMAKAPHTSSPFDRQRLVADVGVVRVFDRETRDQHATLVPSPRGAVVLFDDGRVDSLGAAVLDEPGLVCVAGTHATPWSVCAPALHDLTAFERHLGICR